MQAEKQVNKGLIKQPINNRLLIKHYLISELRSSFPNRKGVSLFTEQNNKLRTFRGEQDGLTQPFKTGTD